jgi:hypothetical protein
MVAHVIEDEVVARPAFGEVFLGVVELQPQRSPAGG